MICIETYLTALIEQLKKRFSERLLYVGLQGSYLRGEADENSDIDLMVILDDLRREDLDAYRGIIETLGCFEKSCGFICSREDMACWNRLEICHLLHSTRDCFGRLANFVPAYIREDVISFVKLSLNNLYHEICHRRIYADRVKNEVRLPESFKSVFFILQNLHYLESGTFCATKAELLDRLNGEDKCVLETAMKLKYGGTVDYNTAWELLFTWCQHTLRRISNFSTENEVCYVAN